MSLEDAREIFDGLMIMPKEVEEAMGKSYCPADLDNLKRINFDAVTLVNLLCGNNSEDKYLLFPGFPVSPADLVNSFPQFFSRESLIRVNPDEMSRKIKVRWYLICTESLHTIQPKTNAVYHLPGFGEVLLMTLLFRFFFKIDLWTKEIVLCKPAKAEAVTTPEGVACKFPTIGPFGKTIELFVDEASYTHTHLGCDLGYAVARRLKT